MSDSSSTDSLVRALAEELEADQPGELDSWGFARKILPVFDLIRSLFSRDELNTALKLMLLYELTRVRGRFDKSRIRSAMPYLEADRVDRLVDSLYEGGWLELRAADRTYELSSTGTHLLAILHAADFENLSPDNVLSRAAQNAQFGAELDGAEETTGYLLDQLLGELQRQVDEAKNVMQKGRPFRLIEWSRRNHRRQLDIIRGVLDTLERQLEDTSEEFRRVVDIHEKMQAIVRLQTGINDRLREWNLEQLYTSGSGYSIPQLAEAVLGMDEEELERVVDENILQVPRLPPTLTTPEIRSRFHAARRTLSSQNDSYDYQPPDKPEPQPLKAHDLDMAGRLRRRLTDLLEARTPEDPPVGPDEWLEAETLPGVAFELAMLSRLEGEGGGIRLDDGRRARSSMPDGVPTEVSPDELLSYLADEELLVHLESGWVCRIDIELVAEAE